MARHWQFPLLVRSRLHSTPWGEKKESLVWRGVTTGDGTRRDFVHRLSERGHDVRFTRVVQGKDGWIANATTHLGENIPIPAMLSRKYMLILPGNDVATGLKWALASNSVVLMPPPEKETWLMEGLLLPWVHYVPVGGPDLVEERLSWLRTHDEDAKRIVSAANEWMNSLLGSFFSPVKEVMTIAAVSV
mgnify:FL=1